MTFAENRTYGVPEFAGTEVNRHSGKTNGPLGWTRQKRPPSQHGKYIGMCRGETIYASPSSIIQHFGQTTTSNTGSDTRRM